METELDEELGSMPTIPTDRHLEVMQAPLPGWPSGGEHLARTFCPKAPVDQSFLTRTMTAISSNARPENKVEVPSKFSRRNKHSNSRITNSSSIHHHLDPLRRHLSSNYTYPTLLASIDSVVQLPTPQLELRVGRHLHLRLPSIPQVGLWDWAISKHDTRHQGSLERTH